MSQTNLRGALFALLAFSLYATHDVLVKLLGGAYSPIQIVFFSVLMGFPLLAVMLIGDRQPGTLRPRSPMWSLLRAGSVVITGVSAFYAFANLPLAQTYAILFAAPLLITLLSIPILGETVGVHRGGAVGVGLVGVLIVLRPGGDTQLELGHHAALVAATGGAFAAVIMRKIGRKERTAVLLLYPMLANIVVMGSLLPLVYEPMPLHHLAGLGAMSLLAFLAMNGMIAAYRNGEAVIVAPMQYSQILWATGFGIVLFNETPDWATFLGASIIIFSGIYIVIREGHPKVSANRPVLGTRSRHETGTYPRVGPMMRSRGFSGQSADE